MSSDMGHWDVVYTEKAAHEVSWFQPEATLSLELIRSIRLPPTAAIVDVGAGASTLVDGLRARGYANITLLDVSERALAVTRARLGDVPIHYEVADIRTWTPPRGYELWHDRAVFHFLTSEPDRAAYRSVLSRAVPTGGHVVLGTFAEDGPERCSGLPVRRYSAAALESEFRSILKPIETRLQTHRTPANAEQRFVFVRFERI